MLQITNATPSRDTLSDYATIPISFHGDSHFRIDRDGDAYQLTETSIAPFFKDYDTLEHPTMWGSAFDLSNWIMVTASSEGSRVGGAIVATRTPGVNMLEDRDDLAVLWDIRVHPDHRKQHVGTALLTEVLRWSKAQEMRELKVETQQLNVAACKFYKKMGFELRTVRENQYSGLPEELQLLWYRNI